MAKFVVQNPVVEFAGGTVSSSVAQCTIALESDDVETTNFGSAGWRERIGGLKGGSVSFEFHQDLAISGVDSVFWSNLGGTASVKVRPGGTAAIGSANPSYEFVALVTEYSPIDSAVGDLATFSVTLPITGAVDRKVAP